MGFRKECSGVFFDDGFYFFFQAPVINTMLLSRVFESWSGSRRRIARFFGRASAAKRSEQCAVNAVAVTPL